MTTAFGKPVEGEIQHYSEVQPDTHTAEDFSAALDRVFEHFAAIQWTQYTPYFNDGDACVFSLHEAFFFTDEQLEEYGKATDGLSWLDGYPDQYGSETYDFRPEEGEYVDIPGDWRRRFVPSDPDDPQAKLYTLTTEFQRVMNGVSQLLHKEFGDPATILATREGFRVEFCEHE